jgi:hypothetical protein
VANLQQSGLMRAIVQVEWYAKREGLHRRLRAGADYLRGGDELIERSD